MKKEKWDFHSDEGGHPWSSYSLDLLILMSRNAKKKTLVGQKCVWGRGEGQPLNGTIEILEGFSSLLLLIIRTKSD